MQATRDESLHLYAHRVRRRLTARPAPACSGATLHDRPLPASAVRALGPLGWGAETFAGGADVFHLTDYAWLPIRRAKLVATIHDVLFARLPHCYTDVMRQNLNSYTRRVVAHADAIVVPSTRTRDDLCHLFDAPPQRVVVTPLAARAFPEGEPVQRDRPYVLCVGTIEPRKNHARLLESFSRLVERHPEAELVLAGGRGWLCDDVVARIQSSPQVTWIGHAEERGLGAWLRGARLVAYPSLGEGFGLPVLEGLAAGKPVLVGRDTTCADLVGEVGFVVDPRSVDSIADGLVALWEATDDAHRTRALAARARERAAALTWHNTARATLDCYRAVFRGREAMA